MNNFNIGACRVFVSNNIEARFADWLDLGFTRGDTTVDILPDSMNFGRADNNGITPLADAVYMQDTGQTVTLSLAASSFDNLMQVMPYAVTNEADDMQAVGYDPNPFINPVSVALVPEFEYKQNDVRSIWASENVHWFTKAYLEITGDFIMSLPEGDDVLSDNAIEVAINPAIGETNNLGGIGSLFILENPINVMGAGDQAALNVAVPDGALRDALVSAGMATVQEMTANTADFTEGAGTETTAGGITDATGIEWLVRTPVINLAFNGIDTIPSLKGFEHLTEINLMENNISTEDLSNLVAELWQMRDELGNNGAAIRIAGNNGLTSEAENMITGAAGSRYAGDGLRDAGVTVNY